MIEKKVGTRKYYELTEAECHKLLQVAEAARANTFPKRHGPFAVALMTKSGSIYSGVSYGSDTATLTMHSEATALAHAAIHGETEIVAITGPSCHICKQLIYESSIRSGIDTVEIIESAGGVKQVPISQMMPYAWPEKPLD